MKKIDWTKVGNRAKSLAKWIWENLQLLYIAFAIFIAKLTDKFWQWYSKRKAQKEKRKEAQVNYKRHFKWPHLLTFGLKDVALIIVLIAYRHGIFETIPALNEFLGIIWSIYNALFEFAVRIINTFTSNVNIPGYWSSFTNWFIGLLEKILQIF